MTSVCFRWGRTAPPPIRTGLLRPGRRPTHCHRRQPAAWLPRRRFLPGGRMKLDFQRAKGTISALAASLHMDPVACAWGIHQVVNENMAAAATVTHHRARTTIRGDLRWWLRAGAGKHVAAVARLLGAGRFVLHRRGRSPA
ncbi:MAG: hydantoinase/oxoprolinase family protein [Caldilineaceae bacterium]